MISITIEIKNDIKHICKIEQLNFRLKYYNLTNGINSDIDFSSFNNIGMRFGAIIIFKL
jgi:hypothetical protein